MKWVRDEKQNRPTRNVLGKAVGRLVRYWTWMCLNAGCVPKPSVPLPGACTACTCMFMHKLLFKTLCMCVHVRVCACVRVHLCARVHMYARVRVHVCGGVWVMYMNDSTCHYLHVGLENPFSPEYWSSASIGGERCLVLCCYVWQTRWLTSSRTLLCLPPFSQEHRHCTPASGFYMGPGNLTPKSSCLCSPVPTEIFPSHNLLLLD